MTVRNEKDLWASLKKAMQGRWTAQRHSDIDFNPGVPDISFVMKERKGVTAWCEMKVWEPKDKNYRLKHYTEHQKEWMMEQHHMGVPVSVLLDVQTGYHLFVGEFILVPGSCLPDEYINYASWSGKTLTGVHEAFINLVKYV